MPRHQGISRDICPLLYVVVTLKRGGGTKSYFAEVTSMGHLFGENRDSETRGFDQRYPAIIFFVCSIDGLY